MYAQDFFGRMRRRWLAALVIGVVLTPLDKAGAHEDHAPLPTRGVAIAGDTIMLSDKAREAMGLTLAKVGFGDIHRTLTVSARVELPWHAQAMVASPVSGRIAQVLVRPGQTVAPGEELARVSASELESLQSTFLEAQAEADLARRLVDQRTVLEHQNVIAGKMLLEAQATLAERSVALAVARQKLAAVGLDDATIGEVQHSGQPAPLLSLTSPIGGAIAQGDVRVGQSVDPTEHLYHVVDPSLLWIVCDVLESDVRFLRLGQQVTASFVALADEMFRGRIEHLGLEIDRATRTQRVVVGVENSGGRLRPGMFGLARVSVEVAREVIVCPRDAVVLSRAGTSLFVQRMPGKYENRNVRLGLAEKGLVEVLDGVFPGDQVVLIGNTLLAALLGHEHKARVTNEQPERAELLRGDVVAAHGSVELPHDGRSLATAALEGRVRRILVQPGQQVSQGDVLAELDSLDLQSIQLELLQSVTSARLIEQSLVRLQGLDGRGATPQREIWVMKSEWDRSRLRAQTLQRQLSLWGLAPEDIARLTAADLSEGAGAVKLIPTAPVRAPASGRIAGFHIVPGQIVHPGGLLFEIHDLSKVWIKGYLYERDADRVQLGQTASAHFAAYPDLQAEGPVVRIAPVMHDHMRVLPVWVEVDNPDHLLKNGMLARIMTFASSAP